MNVSRGISMNKYFPRAACSRSGHRISRTLTLLVALACLIGVSGQALAQNVRTISFDEAIRIALEQNVLLQRAANVTELQAIAVDRSRMAFFPDLSFSSSGSQNYGRNFVSEEGRILNQTTEYVNFGVSTGVNLFNGFYDTATLKKSRYQLEASDLDYDRARQTVVFNVMSTYLTLIEQREQIRVQEENLESERQLLAQIEEFTRVGARPISDLYQQQALTASAELSVIEAQRLAQLSEANLIQVLQLDPFGAYDFEIPQMSNAAPVMQEYQLGNLLQNAFSRRADLQAGEMEIKAAEQDIKAARSNYWPSIGLRANYGSNYTTADERFGLWDQLDQRRGGSLGLSLSVPIFDRFNARNSIQQARVQYDNAKLELQGLKHDVALQVRQAYLDYITSEKTLDVTEKQERSAELALQAAQERYNVGAGTLVELADARARYVTAASSRISARYDFTFRKKLIDYYLGVLNPSEALF